AMDRPWITAGLKWAVVSKDEVPALLVQRVARLRGTQTLVDEFVRYVIGSPEFEAYVQPIVTGVNVPHISGSQIEDFRFRLPPFKAQKEIAKLLGTVDELIENNRRRIGILEEMARLIYREWFVHFRFLGHEDVELVDSDLGPIPEGWTVRPLSAVLELAYGKALKADDRRGGNVAVYGSGGIVGWHDNAFVDGPGIVVGRKGNVGAVYWSDVDFYPIDTTYFVKSEMPLSFVYHQLQTLEFIDSHAAVPGLSRDQAYSLRVVVPARGTLASFDDTVSPMYELRRNLIAQNDVLTNARDLLLPRLISGELDVSDLDLDLEPVA
ncbi:MAG: restriction endonuclease subunit S, partial [Mycobacteriales bacterium]